MASSKKLALATTKAAKLPADTLHAAAVEIVAAGKGRINYDAGVVKAIGLGAVARPTLAKTRGQDILEAREAAVADALRNLAMAVSQVRVTADTRVKNYVLQSDEVKVRVDTLVQGAQVIEEKVLPTSGVYRVVLQIRLRGPDSLRDAMDAAREAERKEAERKAALAAAKPKPDPFAPGMPAPGNAEYTCLIIDCRGLGIAPSPSPKLYDNQRKEVYGTMKVSPEYVNEVGIVGYPRSLSDAKRSTRAGDRPLIIRARDVADGNRFHPIISRQDAEKACRANEQSRFFERTAVLFLVDPL